MNVDQLDGYQQGLAFALARLQRNCDGLATPRQALDNYRDELDNQYIATCSWPVDECDPDTSSWPEAERIVLALAVGMADAGSTTKSGVLRALCQRVLAEEGENENHTTHFMWASDRIRELCWAVRCLQYVIRMQNDGSCVTAIENRKGEKLDLAELLDECDPDGVDPPTDGVIPTVVRHDEPEQSSSSPAGAPPAES